MATGPLPVSPATASTLVWDAENRLIEVKSGTGVNATSLVTYAYDHLSRLVVRTTTAAAPGGATVTRYLYDGWNRIGEYSGQTLQKAFIWGMDLSGSMQGAGGVGGLLAMRVGTSGPIYHPAYDGNGNITEYLSSPSALEEHIEYDPFGNLAGGTAPSDQFVFRFSTNPVDPVTGLDYYGYRWYASLSGRWPSRDPIGERGGVNLNGFVGDDGFGRRDYLGMEGSIRSHVVNKCEIYNYIGRAGVAGSHNWTYPSDSKCFYAYAQTCYPMSTNDGLPPDSIAPGRPLHEFKTWFDEGEAETSAKANGSPEGENHTLTIVKYILGSDNKNMMVGDLCDCDCCCETIKLRTRIQHETDLKNDFDHIAKWLNDDGYGGTDGNGIWDKYKKENEYAIYYRCSKFKAGTGKGRYTQ